MLVGCYLKDADDVDVFPVDWSARLAGSTITASEWLVPEGLELEAGSEAFDDATTACRIGGGEPGRIYHVTNRVTLADGRRLDAELEIAVV